MRSLFSLSFAALLFLVGPVMAAPAPKPMTASHPVGSVSMVASANSVGGVQLGGNQQVQPHIAVGHGPGPREVHVAPVSHMNNAAFNPAAHGMAPGFTGNVQLGHVTAHENQVLRPQGNFPSANVGPYNVAAINQAKQHEHTAAHMHAAHQHTLAADAHRQAQLAHTTAANRHEAHAQAHPAQAQVHNAAAQQHKHQATVHQNQAAFHGTQAQHHRTIAQNAPSHGSLHAAHNSAHVAQQSHGAADASRNRAQANGGHMDAAHAHIAAANKGGRVPHNTGHSVVPRLRNQHKGDIQHHHHSAPNAHNSAQHAHGSARKARNASRHGKRH